MAKIVELSSQLPATNDEDMGPTQSGPGPHPELDEVRAHIQLPCQMPWCSEVFKGWSARTNEKRHVQKQHCRDIRDIKPHPAFDEIGERL